MLSVFMLSVVAHNTKKQDALRNDTKCAVLLCGVSLFWVSLCWCKAKSLGIKYEPDMNGANLSIVPLEHCTRRHDIQYKNIHHNDTHHNGLNWFSMKKDTQHNNTWYKIIKCHKAGCRVLFVVMLNVFMLSIVSPFNIPMENSQSPPPPRG